MEIKGRGEKGRKRREKADADRRQALVSPSGWWGARTGRQVEASEGNLETLMVHIVGAGECYIYEEYTETWID